MPRYDHENLGDVVQTFFKTGTIVRLYEDSNGAKTGLCTVKVSGSLYCNVPLFYHCRGNSELLANGSLKDAPLAFKVGDQVIVQVLGHIESKIPCSDEEICEPALESLVPGSGTSGSGNEPQSPPGGLPALFEGVSSPIQVNCGETTTIQLRCGPNGSQAGLRPAPTDGTGAGGTQATADECTFDISNAVVQELVGGTKIPGTFSNLRLKPNTDSGSSSPECITVDYTAEDSEEGCPCPDDCTPGEVLCTEVLDSGIEIEIVCPEASGGSGACTSDGSALAIVGPTGDEMLTGDTFNFTSNAAEGATFIWSTPDGGGAGDSISYTAPSSNSDCVANFTVSLTCISSDGNGNQSTESVNLFVSVKESLSTNAAYRTGATITSIQLNLVNYDKDEFDCNGDFRTTVSAQINSGNCTGHASCCQITNPDVPNCGTGNASGNACAGVCCSNGTDEEKWENCGQFSAGDIYAVEDLRTAGLKDAGCCPNGLTTSGTEAPY